MAGKQSEESGRTKSRSLAILALCQVFGMSLWFSAAAVLPAPKARKPPGE
jgi:hypothetical protein